jgi:hypothetical protein
MPDLAGPFDGSTFGQAPYYRDRGPLEPSAVFGPPALTAAAGDLGLTAAGFALTMALGRARVRGAAYERTGTAWSYTVPANTSSAGPRRDLLVLRRDLVAKTVVPTYLQGTAAASPADPAITQNEDGTYDLPLFRVQAPASSGTPLVITDLRRWFGSRTWVALPLVNGATALGAGFQAPGFRMWDGDTLELRGVVTNVPAIGTAFGQLPESCRLAATEALSTTSDAVANRVDVLADGRIMRSAGTGSYVTLSGQRLSVSP